LILAAAVVAWMAAPFPARPKAGATAWEAWETPNIKPRETGKWIASIKQHQLWGAMASADSPAAGSAGKNGWRAVGVAMKGGDVFALISIGDKPSAPHRVGDATPDGAKIMKIEEDRLHLMTNGTPSVLKIYRP
jgi:hypothetical protein